MMIEELAPYATILAAIIAAYFTYKNQLKLKSFELLYGRRNEVLKEVELLLSKISHVKYEITIEDEPLSSKKFKQVYFHEGLIIYHQIKACNLGGTVDVLANTFWSILSEPFDKTFSQEDYIHWLGRLSNVLATVYSFGHIRIIEELEIMSFSFFTREIKKYRYRIKKTKPLKSSSKD